ncbi:hypothetical protein JJB07_16785 [Tumebacillus sp. ITR2]|uniref:Uncharacterized protein n=1 Tax=Tumebacillus amylolyticus TaxID=2801339 RepID=A0ABS1JDB8_9BACL|nr:hypothetical protein [Tumebacillus amylolyticus]MBL0388271.1 hypothetical protein [Tumebacillus amylolyticus]
MEWYGKVEDVPNPTGIVGSKDKVITHQFVTSEFEPQLSTEAQFILAGHVLQGPRMVTSLPIRDADSLSLVKEKIVPHFERCILFYEDGVPVSFTISNIKDLSKRRFEEYYNTRALHPLILDLYGKTVPPLDLSVFREKPVIYELNRDFLTGESVEEDTFASFLQQSCLAAEGDLVTVPIGWTFGEHLQGSVYLKFLSSFCNKVYLYVWSSDGTVVGVGGRK